MEAHHKENNEGLQQEDPAACDDEQRQQAESAQDSAEETSLDDDSVDTLKADLERILAEKTALEDQHLRLRAEFENFRRRTRQEADELRKRAAQDLVEALLPVIDNLERATLSTEAAEGVPESFVSGIEMIYKQFLSELEKVGLQKIEAVGTPFDPGLHEAVLHEETEEHPDGHVMEELRRGYIFADRVIRPSMVKVAKGS